MAEIMSKGIEAESSSSAWGQLCRRFSIDEIRSATRNFDEGLVVGKGGFGKVYKATLENGGIAAIKRLDRSRSSQGESEFVSEIKTLSKLRHCHLVSLIGYCNDGQEMILVYEFMPNGTLEQHRARLSWLQRLKIGLGAARGLDYLHTGTGTKHGVIHRDVKSSNILLDHNWDAKISDFGLSKIGPTNQTDSFVKTGLKGTFGYIDPCYFSSARLTRRSDVYSFGVVLFELLCGRAAVDKTLNEEQWGLAGWVQKCIKDGKLLQILDSNIRDQISPKCLKAFVGIAGRCLDNDQDKRPTMAEVVVNLVSIVLLQEKMNSSPAKWTLMDKVFSLFPAKNQVISGSKASPELQVSQLTSSKTAEFFQVKDRGDVRTGSIDTRSNSSLRVRNDNFEKRREASEVVIASHLVIESIPKAIGGEQVVAGWNFEKKREVSEVVIASHPVIEEVSEVVVTSHPVIESIPKAIGGEQVVAGWPSWLVAVAGDAIKGWLPRRADSFEKLEKIGQGTRSNVYKARDLISNKIVALKLVRFDDMDPESVKYMAREILVLRRLDHPNVIKLEGLSTSRISCHLYLVFEYMEHDLTGLASLPGIKFTEPQIKCYMQQLLNGLEHCHSRGVLHRDIKSSNLLIDDHGILKIADFGLASFFDRHQSAPLTSRVVTLWYRPPELLLGATQYGVAVDLWSTGCILGELYAGKPIMPGRTEIDQLHKIFKLCGSPSEDFWRKLPNSTLFKPQHPYERRIEETFKDFPSPAIGLMKTLLAIDPAQRGTATFALKSEFFSSTPHACDPSTLPKYPPSKEIDDKIRDERARRQHAAGKDGQRITKESRRSRATRAIPAPSANAELNVNLMRRRLLRTNMTTASELFSRGETPSDDPIELSRQALKETI